MTAYYHQSQVSIIKELQEKSEEFKSLALVKEKLLVLHIAEMEAVYQALQQRIKELEKSKQVNEEMFLASIESLIRTLEAKDSYTRGHSGRVADYSVRLADKLKLDEQQRSNIRLSASLHDLGKIGVHDHVLNKQGRLTNEEFAIIKQHPDIGANILQPLVPIQELIPNIRYHHERFDGNGYPQRLSGTDIPLGARIIAIADCYDAMTTDRPYREALEQEIAMEEIKKNAGTQFDPELVHEWLHLM